MPIAVLVWRLHLYVGFWFHCHSESTLKWRHSRNAQACCFPLSNLCNTGFQEESVVGKKGRDASESTFSLLCSHNYVG